MKRLMFTVLATGVMASATALRPPAAHALDYVNEEDCFPNPAAVMAAHPDATHVSWVRHNNPPCYFADRFRAGARQAAVQPQQPAVQPQQAAVQPQQPTQPQQQFGILGIPLGFPEPAPQPAVQPPAPQPQQAVQEPAPRQRRHAARPQPQRAIAVAPAPRTTAAAPHDDPAPEPPPLLRLTPPPAAAQAAPQPAAPATRAAATQDAGDDGVADFESRFSASGYHK